MNRFLLKFLRFIRKPPAEAQVGEPQDAEAQDAEPFFCGTMLIRMMEEKREQDVAARLGAKAEEK